MARYPCRNCNRDLRDDIEEELDSEEPVFGDEDRHRGPIGWRVIIRCPCGTANEFTGVGSP